MHTSTHCTIHRHSNFANPPPKVGDKFDNSFSKSKAENIVPEMFMSKATKKYKSAR